MIISDLAHLEIVAEVTEIVGGKKNNDKKQKNSKNELPPIYIVINNQV